MVDSAVTRWGLWAEAKLQEIHKVGNDYVPRWTPEQIFDEPADTVSALGTAGDEALAWLDSLGGSF